MKNKGGISLITLVVTIIVMMILSGVVIMGLADNNPIQKAFDARTMTNIKAIESELHLYTVNSLSKGKQDIDLFPLLKDKNGKLVSADDYYDDSVKEKISKELAIVLSRLQLPLKASDDSDIVESQDINLEYFYILDTSVITSAQQYEGKLLMYCLGTDYMMLHLDGVKYDGKLNYVILPFGKDIRAQFITTTNNIFKLYSNGNLKALGQKNLISGQTVDDYSGTKSVDVLSKFPGYKKFKVSEQSAYVISADDKLYAWGKNKFNTLGTGTNYLIYDPIEILPGKKVKDVWSGTMNTYVLTIDGEIWAAGTNTKGALGQGNTSIYKKFVKIEGIENPLTIERILPSESWESNNVLIICNDRGTKTVYALGENTYNLFQNSGSNVTKVWKLSDKIPELKTADQIGFSGENVAYRKGTNLYVWGKGGHYGNIPFSTYLSTPTLVAENVATISETGNIGIYVGTDQYVYRCANRYVTADGRQTVYEYLKIGDTKVPNAKISDRGHIIVGTKIYYISGDVETRNLYLKAFNYTNVESFNLENFRDNTTYKGKDGVMYINAAWEITRPYNRIQTDSREIKKNVKFVAASQIGINIIDKDDRLWESLSKMSTKITKNINKLAVNRYCIALVTEDGQIYVKGSRFFGGDGDVEDNTDYENLVDSSNKPINNVKAVYLNTYESILAYITNDNKVYYTGHPWLRYFPGQTVNADTSKAPVIKDGITLYPSRLSSPKLDEIAPKIKDIKMTAMFKQALTITNVYILTTDGDVYSYGYSLTNGLGNKNVTDFERVNIPGKVRYIKAEEAYCMALLDNGDVYAWGYNTEGQFGSAKILGDIYLAPTKLNLPGKVMEFGLGEGFAVFGLMDGTVYAAGRNEYGQLGTGDTISTSNFVRAINLEDKLIEE